jgi:hypothetical protein
MKRMNNTRWLWNLALVIALAAGGLIYFIQQDPGFINAKETISQILFVAVVLIGICAISATSRWWMKR